MLDTATIRPQFPILETSVHGKPLIYLDNAATTQKPLAVLDAIRHYYDTENDSPDLAEIIMSRISSQLSTHNWYLKILSENSGVPYETIKKIANGKISNPSLKSILKISLAFGCTIDYLAGKEISPRPSDHS